MPELDRYIHEQASQDAKKKVSATYVMVKKNCRQIAGYYTLSAFGVHINDMPQQQIKRLPRYPIVPATLLGRLAVDECCHGGGYGEFLLFDALKRTLYISQQIGSFAVIVDAKNDTARKFYEHYEFIGFPNQKNRLFLPMKTIEPLFIEQ